MIIDIHTHLGDILYPGGGDLIWQKGIRKKIFYDIISNSELMLHKSAPFFFLEKWIYTASAYLITLAERARNATATLENFSRSMDDNGIKASACMPVPPFLTFDDLNKAAQKEPRLIPFTGVDFTGKDDVAAALGKDVAAGARGLKLHPIIQKTSLTDKKTFEAVEAFAVHDLPVLFHCGISSYYLGTEKKRNQNSDFGAINDAKKLVAAFPHVTFIAGHAGMFQYKEVIALLAGHANVMVDTSIQAPSRVRELISAFGPDRVMYASDWPWGNREPAIKIIKKACNGDKSLERKLFYDNAAKVLRLENMKI